MRAGIGEIYRKSAAPCDKKAPRFVRKQLGVKAIVNIPRMDVGARRGLSAGEIALGRSIFGDALDWESLRIIQAPPLGFGAMVPLGRTIVFSRWRTALDFSNASEDEQGWFIHELAHCWQASRGVVLAFAKLSALGAKAYRVDADQPFAALNIEAQAEVARFVFLARRGLLKEEIFPTALAEARWREASG